jgi:glycosyltransferase involved in cell wall biosynthesis
MASHGSGWTALLLESDIVATIHGPRLAAVIANYNYGHYVGQALDSVLHQIQPFDEVVVVDDGSTDDSPSVLARYADMPHVQVLRIANGGQLGAMRTGIAASQCDYIYTLDADDFAAPNLVASVRPLLGREPAKVVFQLNAVNEDGSPLNSVFPVFPTNYNSSTMIEDNKGLGYYVSPPTSANVFSRQPLERLGYEAFNSRGVIDGTPSLCMPLHGGSRGAPAAIGVLSCPRRQHEHLVQSNNRIVEEGNRHIFPDLGRGGACPRL